MLLIYYTVNLIIYNNFNLYDCSIIPIILLFFININGLTACKFILILKN